ncbi:MAG: hypothetical protein RSA12_10955 [Clostridia bacterium]
MTLERMFERWKEQSAYDDEDSAVEERIHEFLSEGANELAFKRLDGNLTGLADMANDSDSPDPRIPPWTHPAIVDYALYLWFRDGNPVKQQRAQAYLARFQDVLNRMPTLRDEHAKAAMADGRWTLKNLYAD